MKSEDVLSILSKVEHPELGKSIVELGFVHHLSLDSKNITFTLQFNKPRDPFANAIKQQSEKLLKEAYPNHDIKIEQSFTETKNAAAQKPAEPVDTLKNVKNIIAVMSGKGGVGKSTISANIAITLARKGYKVGLVDADIYGPSMPKMFGVEEEKPLVNEKELIIPIEKYGVKMLSIGFFVKPEDALIWRAPMATSALKQLLLQADWGELDFMVIDMPPGTGDIHLTLVNELKLNGAVIVSTPQQVAIADAIKGINMLRHENVNVKILGLVENMAWFTPAELPNNRYYIFGKDGVSQLAKEQNLPLLAQIPLVQGICDSGDSGKPISLTDDTTKGAFETLVDNMLKQL